MQKVLFGCAALALVAVAGPARSQAYIGAGPVGVEIGGGPHYGRYYDEDSRWRHRRWGGYAYGGDCRVVRERVETPSGRVIFRSRRTCY